MDAGLIGTGENSAIFVQSTTINTNTKSGDFVYMSPDGTYTPATSLKSIIGQYKLENGLHKIYLYGIAPSTGLITGSIYYIDQTIPGAITDVYYNGAKKVGIALDANTLFVTGIGDGTTGLGTNGTITNNTFIATQNQVSVDLAYSPDFVFIYNNGVLMPDSSFTAINGYNITFNTALNANDQIKVVSLGIAAIANSGIPKEIDFDSTEGQNSFSLSYVPNQIQVFVNGIKIRSTKYTATNGTSVVFNYTLNLNDWVQFLTYG